jgi:ribose 5-phosphate isomerase A
MSQQDNQQAIWKEQVGKAAASYVEDGMVIGLGTGSTAFYLLRALAERLQAGLQIKGAVPSSQVTYDLAQQLGIPLTTLDAHPELDLYIDGADEIDPQIQLIKGAGGALLREKVVASCAQRFLVIADHSKLVKYLGERFPLPVEVIPFALTPVRRRLEALGVTVQVRQNSNGNVLTDNQNLILDCTFAQGISDPLWLDVQLHSMVGVVEHGLFLQMATQALIAGPQGLQVLP